MIFNSATQAVTYLNELLDEGIQVSLEQLNTILRNSAIEVEKTILVEGKVTKVYLEEIEECSNGKVELILLSPSWIKVLPSIYHDNEFLQRFLFGFQLSAMPHNTMISQIEKQFNPSDTEFVDWLCSWVGIRFSSDVDERAKRRVLHNLVRLYKMRGTKAYFIELIEYLSGAKVRIDDTGQKESLHGSLQQNKKTNRAPFFKVYIDERLGENAEEEKKKLQIIRDIITAEKPVYVNFSIDYPFEHEAMDSHTKTVMQMHYDNAYDYDELRD